MAEQVVNSYDVIVIGAGASGLFFAATDSRPRGGRKLILERTSRPGQKLLMSGNGSCNITHGGSIKDFIKKYGDEGSKIRTCLYKHNNLELMEFIQSCGVKLVTRNDGKVFPESMKAADVLGMLLHEAESNGYEFRLNAEVVGISPGGSSPCHGTDNTTTVSVRLAGGTELQTEKLVIATGGASYPGTGSDGSFLQLLKRDLDLQIVTPKPALAPVYVQGYPFGEISGVSLDDVEISAAGHVTRGPLLFTHRGLSGPSVLHISRYVAAGTMLHINFLPGKSPADVYTQIKSDQPGNSKGIANYLAQCFGLPKALAEKMFAQPTRKLSGIGRKELENVAHLLTDRQFSVSGTGGWNEAMATAGGVALSEMNLKNMSLNRYPAIRVIGEALDICGDTGGYNLQFAYSSARGAQ